MKKTIDYESLKGENNPLLKYPVLYDTALVEFASKPYNDASLNEIIKKSGMSKGSIYHHFGDKFGLLISLLDILVKKKTDFFLPRLKETSQSEDFFNSLKIVTHLTMEYMLEQPLNYKLSLMLLEYDPELMREIIEYFPFDFDNGFGPLLKSAVVNKQIREDIPEEFVIKLIKLIFTNINNIVTGKSPEEVQITFDIVMDVLKNGIASNERRNK